MAKAPKKPKISADIQPAVIDEVSITDTLTTNFMPYAMSVIVSRAIPEIDGFKPSHRKLLYTMYKMGLLNSARTKSANIVGQTMKLNPHGDGAIYETMVRLAKGNESLLHPFVDSKGNFGKVYSRDMAYAASRYTEAKLEAICIELFDDIDRDSVDFVPNYDNSQKEPTLLPTKFPNVLVSANQGIAVGMATYICGFNLAEVCRTTIELIKNPDHDIFSTLIAPDFPTGGNLIYDRAALESIYNTGRGALKVRAKWLYDAKSNVIEISEIPYTTTIESILDKLSELVKTGKVKEISDVRDETDLNGLKIAIDLKRGIDPDKLMQKLFRSTPLEDSFGCNFNILIAGTPRVMGVGEILTEWTAWRTECVRRRVHFDLTKKQDKYHLLLGLKQILMDIDRAIMLIRNTDEDSEVVPNLMIGFGIDEVQAEYIAEIKLRNINKEYILKRLDETNELAKEIERLDAILKSKSKLQGIIVSELQSIIKKYEAPRHTSIIYSEDIEEFDEDESDYAVNIFMSRDGYFKKITNQSLRMNGEHKLKEGDNLIFTCEAQNRSEIIFITNLGAAYKSRLCDFDDTKASVLGDYLPSKLAMTAGESPIFAFLPGSYSGSLIYVFANGKCARIGMQCFDTKSNRRRLAGAVSDKSPLIAAFAINEDAEIAIASSGNRMALVNTAMLPEKALRTAQGVQVMSLKYKQSIEFACLACEAQLSDPKRYRVKAIPSAGAIIKPEDQREKQLTLE